MPANFFTGPNWQQSSDDTLLTRKVHKLAADDATYIIWPVDAGQEIGGGDKDVLASGDHPIVAFGAKAHRPRNFTGVVEDYLAADLLVTLDLTEKKIVRQYVHNVLTYADNVPATWVNTIIPGQPVYVDDSAALTAGVTVSFSPLNSAGSGNPLAGYIFWCQDEYKDSGVGGLHAAQSVTQPAVADTSEEILLCVMLTNDYGYQA